MWLWNRFRGHLVKSQIRTIHCPQDSSIKTKLKGWCTSIIRWNIFTDGVRGQARSFLAGWNLFDPKIGWKYVAFPEKQSLSDIMLIPSCTISIGGRFLFLLLRIGSEDSRCKAVLQQVTGFTRYNKTKVILLVVKCFFIVCRECEIVFGDRDQNGEYTLLNGDHVTFNLAIDKRDSLKRATNVTLLEESLKSSGEKRERVCSHINAWVRGEISKLFWLNYDLFAVKFLKLSLMASINGLTSAKGCKMRLSCVATSCFYADGTSQNGNRPTLIDEQWKLLQIIQLKSMSFSACMVSGNDCNFERWFWFRQLLRQRNASFLPFQWSSWSGSFHLETDDLSWCRSGNNMNNEYIIFAVYE